MKQNKAQFIVDYYVTINNKVALQDIMIGLKHAGCLFVVEPWPEDHWRVYVRKDMAFMLEKLEEVIQDANATGTEATAGADKG